MLSVLRVIRYSRLVDNYGHAAFRRNLSSLFCVENSDPFSWWDGVGSRFLSLLGSLPGYSGQIL